MVNCIEPYTFFVLDEVRSDPGISYARLYGCKRDKAMLEALVDGGYLSREDGVHLTAEGESLWAGMQALAVAGKDARHEDVRTRIRARYERRLAYQRRKRDE